MEYLRSPPAIYIEIDILFLHIDLLKYTEQFLLGAYIQPVLLTRPTNSNQQRSQQSGMSMPNACTTTTGTPITFPNQNVTADQLVQAVYLNQRYGKHYFIAWFNFVFSYIDRGGNFKYFTARERGKIIFSLMSVCLYRQ